MTPEEMRTLKPGDYVRHVHSADGYLVTDNYGTRATAVRTADITNPNEWVLVGPVPRDQIEFSKCLVKRKNGRAANAPPDDWYKYYLKLWEEDDAEVPDRETAASAFLRITGLPKGTRPVRVLDEGIEIAKFYRDGWVVIHDPDGSEVGVLVDWEELEC